MTWAEIKRAVEQAGIQDDDQISAIECEILEGDKTFQKIHVGNFVKLSENIAESVIRAERTSSI
ncbi:MAG: hypothetical protein H0T53_02210 [Herpetosiphonaceae bacterium]|nr:hypothetical protein [Herpetosiphonaceae bacterium]